MMSGAGSAKRRPRTAPISLTALIEIAGLTIPHRAVAPIPMRAELGRLVRLPRFRSARHPKGLHDQTGLVVRQPEAAEGVAHHPERQLALAHDGHADALALQVVDLTVSMRPHHRVDPRVGPPGELEDTPRLEPVGRGDHEEVGVLHVRSLQHARRRRITPDRRPSLREDLFSQLAVPLDDHVRQVLLAERATDRSTDPAVADDDGMALPARGVGAGPRADQRIARSLQARQERWPRLQPAR